MAVHINVIKPQGLEPLQFPTKFRVTLAHAVVKGDGDGAWGQALNDFSAGSSKRVYEGGRVDASQCQGGCAGICCRKPGTCGRPCKPSAGVRSIASFMLRSGGPTCSEATAARVGSVESRRSSICVRRGYRFIALADDNFYPVSLTDIKNADSRQNNAARVAELTGHSQRSVRVHGAPGTGVAGRHDLSDANHDGSGVKTPASSIAMRKAHIEGRAGGGGGGDAGRPQGRSQKLQCIRRESGTAIADLPTNIQRARSWGRLSSVYRPIGKRRSRRRVIWRRRRT